MLLPPCDKRTGCRCWRRAQTQERLRAQIAPAYV